MPKCRFCNGDLRKGESVCSACGEKTEMPLTEFLVDVTVLRWPLFLAALITLAFIVWLVTVIW